MWKASQVVIPEYPTSERVQEGLAGLIRNGEMMVKPGRLSPVTFTDIISPWLTFYPQLSPFAVGPGPGTEDRGVMNVNRRLST
jgi:hypothetical protein